MVEITAECIWVGFTPTMKGRLDALCCGLPFEEIAALPKGSRFALGQALKVTVTEVDLEKFHLDLALDDNPPNIQEGALIAGRVARAVAGTGLYVDLGYARSGRVPLTAIRDAYADGLADGQAVKVGTPVLARVTRVDGGKVDLSLRASRGGCEGRGAVPEKTKKGYKPVNPEVPTRLATRLATRAALRMLPALLRAQRVFVVLCRAKPSCRIQSLLLYFAHPHASFHPHAGEDLRHASAGHGGGRFRQEHQQEGLLCVAQPGR